MLTEVYVKMNMLNLTMVNEKVNFKPEKDVLQDYVK